MKSPATKTNYRQNEASSSSASPSYIAQERNLECFEARLKKYSEYTDWLMWNRAAMLYHEVMCTKKGFFKNLECDWVQREETSRIEMLYTFESFTNGKHVLIWFEDLWSKYKAQELVFCPYGVHILDIR